MARILRGEIRWADLNPVRGRERAGLPYELGLSPRRTEALSIKIELDSNPPVGGVAETSIIRRYVVLNVLHYDKASMLSGKLHAIHLAFRDRLGGSATGIRTPV